MSINILNFIMTKLNPKTVEDLNFEQKEGIIKKVNFNFIEKLTDEEYRRFIDRDDKMIRLLKTNDNINKLLKHIRFGILVQDEIKSVIENIKENKNFNNDVTIQLVAKLLSELPIDEFKDILAQNPFIQDVLNSKVINQLKSLNGFKQDCELFMENLNTLIDNYKEVKGDGEENR